MNKGSEVTEFTGAYSREKNKHALPSLSLTLGVAKFVSKQYGSGSHPQEKRRATAGGMGGREDGCLAFFINASFPSCLPSWILVWMARAGRIDPRHFGSRAGRRKGCVDRGVRCLAPFMAPFSILPGKTCAHHTLYPRIPTVIPDRSCIS